LITGKIEFFNSTIRSHRRGAKGAEKRQDEKGKSEKLKAENLKEFLCDLGVLRGSNQ
jgi:hypothetical protein